MVSIAIHQILMPRIVVFAGKGSSHSWTWFADYLEQIGEFDARFLGSDEFVDSLEKGPETVVLSGGDGYAIAESLKSGGFSGLKRFVSSGGRYVGICAGAYLPLPSRIPPFSGFNLSTTRIENIDYSLRKKEEPPRVSVPYGLCSILHPVRGEVELTGDSIRTYAPLYGGPVFKEPEDDEVMLRYTGFATDTEYQIDRGRAEAMVLGRPAAILCEHGDGELLLLGPHLEHPRYPEANGLLGDLLGLAKSTRRGIMVQEKMPSSLARSLADLKVAATGLEGRSFLVGRKLWDASRFLELAWAIEKRAWIMGPEDAEGLRYCLDTVRGILLRTEIGVESNLDEATVLLVNGARVCVDTYFRSMVGR